MADAHLGKYRILRSLAMGGMGEVLLARQEGPAGFSKTVVLKRILNHLATDRGFVQLFLDEARLAALLTHPNIVQVFELGEDQGSYFLAMEYVHGKSLRATLNRLQQLDRRLSEPAVVRLGLEVLRGLQYAHRATNEGVPLHLVHRDITPENLLLGFAGEVKVTDFGIAKAASATSATRPGVVKGKFAYLAPEILEERPFDCRSDLYSLGVVLFEALAGQAPFTAQTDAGLTRKVLTEPAPPLETLAPSASVEFCAVVSRALEKSPERRFASAAEMTRALEACETDTLDSVATLMGTLFDSEGPLQQSMRVPGQGTALLFEGSQKGPPLKSSTTKTTLERVGSSKGRTVVAVAALVSLALTGVWVRGSSWTPSAKPSQSVSTVAASQIVDAGAEPLPLIPVAVPSPPPAPSSAPTRERTKTVAASRPKIGKVFLLVKPWAEVSWHGQSLGMTPLTEAIEVPSGIQVFILRNSDLGIVKRVRVPVRAGESTSIKINLLEP